MLDVRCAARTEIAIDAKSLGPVFARLPVQLEDLVHFEDGILTFHYTVGAAHRLLCLNLNFDRLKELRPGYSNFQVLIPSVSKLFVRNNPRYVIYGEYSGRTAGGHHEWVMVCYDFKTRDNSDEVQLQNFFGMDLGQTVCFEVFDGYFYAVSSQSTQEVEEIDWSSFYHCFRVPVDDFRKEKLQHERLWRRQHREGPINDAWTDLSLQKDETTGKVTIVEARQEFLNGGSEQTRSFYFHSVEFDHEDRHPDTAESSDHNLSRDVKSLLPNDPLVSTLDNTNKPQYAPAKPRTASSVHAASNTDEHGRPLKKRRPSQTVFKTYALNASSSLDLIHDDTIVRYTRPKLRLQIGSRITTSPINPSTGRLFPPLLDDNSISIPDSIDRYANCPTKLFPPADAPPALFELMNPSTRIAPFVPGMNYNRVMAQANAPVQASWESNMLVYMAGQGDGVTGRAIVMMNFDPAVKFLGLRRMDMRDGMQVAEGAMENALRGVVTRDEMARARAGEGRMRRKEEREMGHSSKVTWYEGEARAWWMEIDNGFEFLW